MHVVHLVHETCLSCAYLHRLQLRASGIACEHHDECPLKKAILERML